jgi:hypothetical protein
LVFGELPWQRDSHKLTGQARMDMVIAMKKDLDITDYGYEIPGRLYKP